MFFSVFHQVKQVDFLAPRAAVALGFDSDVFLAEVERVLEICTQVQVLLHCLICTQLQVKVLVLKKYLSKSIFLKNYLLVTFKCFFRSGLISNN